MSIEVKNDIVTKYDKTSQPRPEAFFPKEFYSQHRPLTKKEIKLLQKNGNRFLNDSQKTFWIHRHQKPQFLTLIQNCEFKGTIILDLIQGGRLHYHDLDLEIGLYNSYLENCSIGEDCVIRNVRFLFNYRIDSHVILFNIEEMSCTLHSKFGNGLLKEGEGEADRIWIDVRNENSGRRLLAYEGMTTGDAWLWSEFKEDELFQQRLFEMTTKRMSSLSQEFGLVEGAVVIKNTRLLKDVKIMTGTYIKGALKLKNLTICSSLEEPSQIGEGVEMVNGIMGYGSKVFYQAVAVRFVLGRNCQLKYGARLLHSVLGDNSTVSCCEVLNNLIYPFHEQHHNTSFLIAAWIKGQSNFAAGATAGSNHNSRSADGELIAGRGFWPGLSAAFTHNSRFASFCLATKGSYRQSLDIRYPFSLVSIDGNNLQILPAFWFSSNMYALQRNRSKFKGRDGRAVKVPHIETDPVAPDTVIEMMKAMERLENLTAQQRPLKEGVEASQLLLDENEAAFNLFDSQSQKRYGATVLNGGRAYREYRQHLLLFAAETLQKVRQNGEREGLSRDFCKRVEQEGCSLHWENVGGQLVPSERVEELREKIKAQEVKDWEGVHSFFERLQENYEKEKQQLALEVIKFLYKKALSAFTPQEIRQLSKEIQDSLQKVRAAFQSSREKDFKDPFRSMVYNNDEQRLCIIGDTSLDKFFVEAQNQLNHLQKEFKILFEGF